MSAPIVLGFHACQACLAGRSSFSCQDGGFLRGHHNQKPQHGPSSVPTRRVLCQEVGETEIFCGPLQSVVLPYTWYCGTIYKAVGVWYFKCPTVAFSQDQARL
ncbi:hypothetical protein CDAR_286021 [Caerostris darwini]|uniref:Uncharacterized protein n=1 Tax=Caerostris darwini TaxID=1538125 RepID=A0AAV4N522_9ARAC|nr:hypothetical protein CDAR_286021 [Caerostris darwini]